MPNHNNSTAKFAGGSHLKRDAEIVLNWLYRNESASTYWALSAETGLPEARISEILEELQEKGLMITTASVHQITELGKSTAEKILEEAKWKRIDVVHAKMARKPLG